MPFLPPEIVGSILEKYCSHDHSILLIPKHCVGTDYNQPQSVQVPNAPPLSFFLANHAFCNQGIRDFHSNNAFSLLGGAHVNDLLGMLGPRRTLIRHITLESQWEFEAIFLILNQQETYKFAVNHLWGRYTLEDLVDYSDTSRCIFPNLQSISLRVRCKWNKDWQWHTPSRPQYMVLEHPNKRDILELCDDIDPMEQESTRSLAEQKIASAIKEIWGYCDLDAYVPMTNISFQYNEMEQWNERVATVPLQSVSWSQATS